MRLFLSSENFGAYQDELLRLVGDNKKVAYIGNAKDYNEADRRLKVPQHKQQFEDLGFEFTEFDLRDYFGKRKITEDDLSDFGLVWASGGNTFLLRRAMNDSGFDKILIDLIKRDRLAYGGSSAGSIVATPSLKGTEYGDDPEQVSIIYGKEIMWDGLNFIPKHLVVHYKSGWFGAEAQKMVDYFESNSIPFQILKDGQVCIVDGEREELLT